jgi:hypothetical protein
VVTAAVFIGEKTGRVVWVCTGPIVLMMPGETAETGTIVASSRQRRSRAGITLIDRGMNYLVFKAFFLRLQPA